MPAARTALGTLPALLLLWVLGDGVWGAEGAAVPDAASDALALTVVRKAGIGVGVCELPRVGDGRLAAALARRGIAQVHGLAPDTRAADAARIPAAASGVLGSQVIVETGSPAAIPLGDWVADLLVVADASDANLHEVPPAEARRALAPYRGVAVVGRPKDGKAALSKAALTAWADQTGGAAVVSDDEDGLWAVVRMPALAGGDDWSHHMHGADGDLVSNDRAFGAAPFALQWTGRPYAAGHWDIHVVSAGRMFSAECSVFQHPNLPYEVVARGAYNGQVLWRRPIAQDFGESSSLVIATPERLFLKDRNQVLVLDPESGKELNRVVATADESRQCLLLLLSDGVLLTLTGPTQTYSKNSEDYGQGPSKQRSQDETNELYEGQELTAWNAADGRQLWRFQDEKIDPGKIAISDGRVYLYAARAYAACLELRSGAQIWKTDAPIAEPRGTGLGYVSGHATVKTLSMYRDGAIATKDVYFINYLPHRHCQAFAAADGHLLWDKMRGPTETDPLKATTLAGKLMFMTPIVIGGTIYERSNWQHGSGGFDLLSGNAIKGIGRFDYGGCGRFTGLASGLLIGQNGEVCDVEAHRNVLDWNAKSTCGSGQFVADGLLFKVASACPGCSEWRGFFAGRSLPEHEPRAGGRLETGTAASSAPAPSDAADWPTYRADDTRRGSSSAAIVEQGAIAWTFTPQVTPFNLGAGSQYLMPDVNPTQPIAVGERVWFGTAEGAVVCLDRRTGAEAWRYWTAGRIWTSPTWSQGRIYAGSCDGWVYCLDAATGALAWRYRVAPEERRVMILGHLSSAWPIMGTVVVEDGAVYAVGGLVGQFGGSELCALDAGTGSARWNQHSDISASGQLAWYAGKLWWHAGDRGLFIVDPATGGVRSASGGANLEWGRSRGQDIGILPGGWVACGGRQLNLPAAHKEQDRNICAFLRADADGPTKDAQGRAVPALVRLDKSQSYDSIPVWDADEVLLFGKPAGWQGASTTVPRPLPPVFCRDLAATLTAEAEARVAEAVKKAEAAKKPDASAQWYSSWSPAAEQARAALPDTYLKSQFGANTPIYSAVLGKNAWAFVNGAVVYAVSRPERKLLWRVKLPGAALVNGMSLTRGGDVLVALIDGRVVCIGAAPAAP